MQIRKQEEVLKDRPSRIEAGATQILKARAAQTITTSASENLLIPQPTYAIPAAGDTIPARATSHPEFFLTALGQSPRQTTAVFFASKTSYGRRRSQEKAHHQPDHLRQRAEGAPGLFDRRSAARCGKCKPGRAASHQDLHICRWPGAGSDQPHRARLFWIPLVLHKRRTISLRRL